LTIFALVFGAFRSIGNPVQFRDCARSCVILNGLHHAIAARREGGVRDQSEDLPETSLTVGLGGKSL
jgi:hypothetical protein